MGAGAKAGAKDFLEISTRQVLAKRTLRMETFFRPMCVLLISVAFQF